MKEQERMAQYQGATMHAVTFHIFPFIMVQMASASRIVAAQLLRHDLLQSRAKQFTVASLDLFLQGTL